MSNGTGKERELVIPGFVVETTMCAVLDVLNVVSNFGVEYFVDSVDEVAIFSGNLIVVLGASGL